MRKITSVLASFFAVAAFFMPGQPAMAYGQAMVTIRFDDGLLNQITNAAPILAKYKLPATGYVFTDSLQEGNWAGQMTWVDVQKLKNTYGWEIGSHTESTADLTQVSDSQLVEELAGSKKILAQHGINTGSIALPSGAYNNKVLSQAALYYNNVNLADDGFNEAPYNDFGVAVHNVYNTTPVAQIKDWINEAIANKFWLVLLFHGIVDASPATFEYPKADFDAAAAYIKSTNVKVVNITAGLAASGSNLVANPTFDLKSGGWASGWTRTDSANIKLDAASMGCLPKPVNSVAMTGGAESRDLYTTNLIKVASGREYALKVYFNCPDYESGGIDVYADEYDASGKWVNWTWLTGIWDGFTGYRTAVYKPSSGAAKLRLWIESAPGSDLKCYVDSVSLI